MSRRRRSEAPGRPAVPRRSLLTGGVLLALGALLTGCTEVEATTEEGYSPAKVEEIKGSEVKRVTFTADGAEQVGLQTVRATQRAGQAVVPYTALIYSPDGGTWVYTTPQPLTFVRKPVVVDRIDGDQVLLSGGLSPGAPVVTVGAAEVYGAELDIAGH